MENSLNLVPENPILDRQRLSILFFFLLRISAIVLVGGLFRITLYHWHSTEEVIDTLTGIIGHWPESGPSSTTSTIALVGGFAISTLISEDLTCISAGLLVSKGQIAFLPATIGCLAGIFVGDLLVFISGRIFGRTMLHRRPFRWFVSDYRVDRASDWFRRRGMAAVFISRFVPGMRVPTYFAAGMLRTNFKKFTIFFLVAASAWTPLLVGTSAEFGDQAFRSSILSRQSQWLTAVLILLFFASCLRFGMRLTSFRGRRMLVSRWRRITRWKFWPLYVFYAPIVVYIAYLCAKFRSLTLFTCVNPGIPASGFVGESKSQILRQLSLTSSGRRFVARFRMIPATLRVEQRIEWATRFMTFQRLDFPVILKPDMGQRGEGVAVIRSHGELSQFLTDVVGDTIIQ